MIEGMVGGLGEERDGAEGGESEGLADGTEGGRGERGADAEEDEGYMGAEAEEEIGRAKVGAGISEGVELVLEESVFDAEIAPATDACAEGALFFPPNIEPSFPKSPPEGDGFVWLDEGADFEEADGEGNGD